MVTPSGKGECDEMFENHCKDLKAWKQKGYIMRNCMLRVGSRELIRVNRNSNYFYGIILP